MDMQVKLEITTGSYNSDKKKTDIKYINEENYPDGKLGSEFIKFKEYNFVTVKFESRNEEDVLHVQTYDSEGFKIIRSGETAVISSGKDEDDMLVPGFYSISVKTQDKNYDGLFMVEPASISWNGLINMRKYLDKTVYGLSRNLYSKKIIKKSSLTSNSFISAEIYNFIKNNESVVVNNIKSIVENPKTDIVKAYRLRYGGQGKSNLKSLKMSVRKTNISKDSSAPDIAYEVHTALSTDTAENRWTRKIIHYTIMCLCSLEEDYKSLLCAMYKKSEEKNCGYEKAVDEYNKVANDITIADNLKNRMKKRAEGMLSESSEFSKDIISAENIIEDTKKFRSNLTYYEYETWLYDIKDYEKIKRPSFGMIRDSRYYMLYEYYEKLMSIVSGNNVDNKNTFQFKRTSKLFEYYVVVMAIEIVESHGYEWKKGWIADEADIGAFSGEIPTESKMYFRKGNILCEIAYDLEIENEPPDEPFGRFVRNNARNCRPDIRVTFYNSETGEVQSSVIIEVKCRKARYIYNENADTPVIAHINDYYNLGYKYSDKKYITRGIVDMVAVVYPKQESEVHYKGACNYSFIQVEPSEDLKAAYGYEKIEKAIFNIKNS